MHERISTSLLRWKEWVSPEEYGTWYGGYTYAYKLPERLVSNTHICRWSFDD